MNFFKLVKTKDCFTMGVQTTIPDSDSLDGSKCSLKIVNTSSGREKLSMKIHKKKKKIKLQLAPNYDCHPVITAYCKT